MECPFNVERMMVVSNKIDTVMERKLISSLCSINLGKTSFKKDTRLSDFHRNAYILNVL